MNSLHGVIKRLLKGFAILRVSTTVQVYCTRCIVKNYTSIVKPLTVRQKKQDTIRPEHMSNDGTSRKSNCLIPIFCWHYYYHHYPWDAMSLVIKIFPGQT